MTYRCDFKLKHCGVVGLTSKMVPPIERSLGWILLVDDLEMVRLGLKGYLIYKTMWMKW